MARIARMPKPRKRYDARGKPRPCAITLPPALAAYLYRECVGGKYRDETQLVTELVRKWADEQKDVDWPAVLAALKKADREAEDDSK